MEAAFPPLRKVVLIVEADNWAAARKCFEEIQKDTASATLVVPLSAGLAFTQAQESGRFWKFEYRPVPHRDRATPLREGSAESSALEAGRE